MRQYQEAYNIYNEALAIDPQNIMTNAKLHFNKATVAAKVYSMHTCYKYMCTCMCAFIFKILENYLYV